MKFKTDENMPIEAADCCMRGRAIADEFGEIAMIHFRCPKCEQPVVAAPEAAGQRVQCGACLALVQVPGGALAAPPADPPPSKPLWSRPFSNKLAIFIPLILIGAGVGGYLAYQHFVGSKVWIYVDNTGERALTIRLDGDVKATVAPGTFAVVKCRDGKHRIQVERGDESVFDEEKELSKPNGDRPTKYLLNPDATGHYHTHSVEYGVGFSPWGIRNLQPHVQRLLPLIANDANLFPGQREDAVQNTIFWALRDVTLAEPGVWRDISKFDIVLEQAPKQIKGNLTGKQEVFARLTRADYDVLKAINMSQKLTKQELANAVRAMDHIVKAELPQ